jgi:hypothetical protein
VQCALYAETCLRLAIGSYDPEITKELFALAGEWLAKAAEAELAAVGGPISDNAQGSAGMRVY